MKPTSTLFTVFAMVAGIFLQQQSVGQAPEKISYQAVIRNGSGHLMTNHNIGIQISILHGAIDGEAVYIERHFPVTNENGLVTVEIGSGTVIKGNFITINWANGIYFIKTETDPNGGANYTISGTSQILSVPYALHAKTAENVTGTIIETDPVYLSSQAANITANDISNLGNLSGTNTGDQDLSHMTTQSALEDSASGIREDFPDVSNFISSETDPVYVASRAANITAEDITNLNNLSGINTGDQDLNALATKTALEDSTAQLRSEIPDVSGFISTESQNLSQVLTEGNDGGAAQIKNISDPTDDQDASTKAYVDALESKLKILINTLKGGGFVTDIDGNEYNTVKIGDQVWMAENLKTTKFNDGAEIPLVTDNGEWNNLITPGYCWYENSQIYCDTYGALYNWHTVNTGKLCPVNWHVPSDDEWSVLENYLIANGYNYDDTWDDDGDRTTLNRIAKALGSATNWINSVYSGTVGNTDYPSKHNLSGFSALPGGFRINSDGSFYGNGWIGCWWSSSEYPAEYSARFWYRRMTSDSYDVGGYLTYDREGLSVRCLKD